MIGKVSCSTTTRWIVLGLWGATGLLGTTGCASVESRSKPTPPAASAEKQPKSLVDAMSGSEGTAVRPPSNPPIPGSADSSPVARGTPALATSVSNETHWAALGEPPLVRRTPPLAEALPNQQSRYETTETTGTADSRVQTVSFHSHGCQPGPNCPCDSCPTGDPHHHPHLVLGHRHPYVPRELQKVSMPDYVIEPPDILLVDVIKAVPKAPYRFSIFDTVKINVLKAVPAGPHRLEAFDVIYLQVAGLPERFPIEGNYSINPGGVLDLGAPYGSVNVGGKTLEETKAAIQRLMVDFRDPVVEAYLVQGALPPALTGEYVISPSGTITLGTFGEVYIAGRTRGDAENVVRHHLQQNGLEDIKLSLELSTFAAIQQVVGEHMVGPDGTVMLGGYGQVYVTGMTRSQARAAVEAHLSLFLEDPRVSLDVFAYNSKVYYVIVQGTGVGDGVFRLPVTGNETVLDAIAQIEGLRPQSSKKIWVARPKPHTDDEHCEQLLEVNWRAIVKGGSTQTNYQLFPGDRLYIAEDSWWTVDSFVAKVTSPFERLFGFNLLGASVVSRYRFFKQQGTNGNNGGGLGF